MLLSVVLYSAITLFCIGIISLKIFLAIHSSKKAATSDTSAIKLNSVSDPENPDPATIQALNEITELPDQYKKFSELTKRLSLQLLINNKEAILNVIKSCCVTGVEKKTTVQYLNHVISMLYSNINSGEERRFKCAIKNIIENHDINVLHDSFFEVLLDSQSPTELQSVLDAWGLEFSNTNTKQLPGIIIIFLSYLKHHQLNLNPEFYANMKQNIENDIDDVAEILHIALQQKSADIFKIVFGVLNNTSIPQGQYQKSLMEILKIQNCNLQPKDKEELIKLIIDHQNPVSMIQAILVLLISPLQEQPHNDIYHYFSMTHDTFSYDLIKLWIPTDDTHTEITQQILKTYQLNPKLINIDLACYFIAMCHHKPSQPKEFLQNLKTVSDPFQAILDLSLLKYISKCHNQLKQRFAQYQQTQHNNESNFLNILHMVTPDNSDILTQYSQESAIERIDELKLCGIANICRASKRFDANAF